MPSDFAVFFDHNQIPTLLNQHFNGAHNWSWFIGAIYALINWSNYHRNKYEENFRLSFGDQNLYVILTFHVLVNCPDVNYSYACLSTKTILVSKPLATIAPLFFCDAVQSSSVGCGV
jgi:hypothetical protein